MRPGPRDPVLRKASPGAHSSQDRTWPRLRGPAAGSGSRVTLGRGPRSIADDELVQAWTEGAVLPGGARRRGFGHWPSRLEGAGRCTGLSLSSSGRKGCCSLAGWSWGAWRLLNPSSMFGGGETGRRLHAGPGSEMPRPVCPRTQSFRERTRCSCVHKSPPTCHRLGRTHKPAHTHTFATENPFPLV